MESEAPPTPASFDSGEGLLAPGFLGSIPQRRTSARLSTSGRRPSLRERPAQAETSPPAGPTPAKPDLLHFICTLYRGVILLSPCLEDAARALRVSSNET